MAEPIVITHAQLRMERITAYRDDLPTGPAYLRRRDLGGNKLVDVVNQDGFCIGTRSPLESGANNVPGKPRSGISASHDEVEALPQHDPNTGLWWVGKNRLVQRMIDTPDGPLQVARVVKPHVAEKLDARAEAAAKVKRAPKTGADTKRGRKPRDTDRTGVTGISSGPTAKEIADYVASKYGFTGKLTAEIRRAARVAMEHDRQVREYKADAPKAAAKGKGRKSGRR